MPKIEGISMFILKLSAYGILAATLFTAVVAIVDLGELTAFLIAFLIGGLTATAALLGLDKMIEILGEIRDGKRPVTVSQVDSSDADPYAFVDQAAARLAKKS